MGHIKMRCSCISDIQHNCRENCTGWCVNGRSKYVHTHVDQVLSRYEFAQCVNLLEIHQLAVDDGFARGSLVSTIKYSIKYIFDICCFLYIICCF